MHSSRLHATSACSCSAPAAACRPAARWRQRRAVRVHSQSAQDTGSTAERDSRSALLIEVDGALADLHMDGHRQAFNRAFKELGLECTCWSAHVYSDLLSQGDGTGEGLVTAYFSTVGWPSFLPTSEQHIFARNVHNLKQKQLKVMLSDGQLPLRDGVEQVIDDALAAGARVACLSETLSAPSDDVAGSLWKLLGSQRSEQLRLVSAALHDGERETGEDGMSWEQSLSEASARAKQQAAEALVAEVGRAVSSSSQSSSILQGIAVDPNLLTAASRSSIRPAWLQAVGATLDVPCARCIVVAANNDTISAAAGAGMVAVALPRRLAHQATFVGAKAKFEGWGPGLATWPRLASLLPQQ